MKHKKIVFVCTGNTCRSPMAEAALKKELRKRKIRWYSVSSAGLRAKDGAPMSENSRRALQEAGIPVSETFASRRLTPKILSEAYAVVCMTEEQARLLAPAPNVTCMYALAGRDIPDPYGQGIDVYRATLRAIAECMPSVIRGLDIKNEK